MAPLEQSDQFANTSVAKELSARYKLLKMIGQGGCGVVYLAYDQFEERQVAIKLAQISGAEGADGKLHKLWINEIRLSGQLKHPFIVDTYEAGFIKDGGYIVMEYLPGGTLKPFTQPDKLLPAGRVVEILFKVCKALEYVSSLGILHRDIKPGNILLNANGEAKVTDFGACYQSNGEETQVLNVGSLNYVPPEQFRNAIPNVQFDIYATGVMAYMLLTGHSPYTGNTSESLIYQKLNVDPPPLSKWRQDIPARLSEVVLRAIARDPAQRYSDWKTLSDDLEQTLSALNNKETLNDSSKYASLSQLDFFHEFGQKELWETVQISTWIRYQPGDKIVSEGDAGTSIYIIVVGEASVLRGGINMNRMKKGSCFGELAYIDKATHLRTASVVASTMLVALCIEGERLRNSSDGLRARFASAMLRAMLGKIAQADSRYIALVNGVA